VFPIPRISEEIHLGRRKRGWKAAAGLSLKDLHRLFEAKESQIAKLTKLREKLASELADVEGDLAAAGGGVVSTADADVATAPKRGPGRPPGKRGPGRPKGKRGRPKGSKNKVSAAGRRGPRGEGGVQTYILKALASTSGPMKLADLAKKVIGLGYKTSSSRFNVIVGQRVSEMKGVKKVGRGMYQLK
jgi:hypothetical protein